MKKWLIGKVRDAARRLGVEVHRSNLYSRDDWRMIRFLEHHEINTVLDVGANRGQFAKGLFQSGFTGQIVSFEALPHIFEELGEAARAYGESWTIAPRCALSDEEGTVQFHVTKQNSSSSMLKPAELSCDMSGIFSVTETIDVDSRRLDRLVEEIGINSTNIFLKLDVQGGEKKVLEGATELMPHVRGVILEMSLQSLYDGQALANELDDILIEQGFKFWDSQPVFRNTQTGRLIQYDGIYFRD
jgi:FkbM family methyltransferase